VTDDMIDAMMQESYREGLRACRWLNEFSDTHRVLNCKADIEEFGSEDWWLVTELGQLGLGDYLTDAELIAFAKSKGFEVEG